MLTGLKKKKGRKNPVSKTTKKIPSLKAATFQSKTLTLFWKSQCMTIILSSKLLFVWDYLWNTVCFSESKKIWSASNYLLVIRPTCYQWTSMEQENVYLGTTSKDSFHSDIRQIHTALHVDLLLGKQEWQQPVRAPRVSEAKLSFAQPVPEIPNQKELWPLCIDLICGSVQSRKIPQGETRQLFCKELKLKT